MITPHVLKELLFLCAGIGSVLGIKRYPSLGIGIGTGREKMASERLYKQQHWCKQTLTNIRKAKTEVCIMIY